MTLAFTMTEQIVSAIRVPPGPLAICTCLTIMLVTAFACGSDEAPTALTEELDIPNPSNRFDLSDMDAATTEAEIIRLLGEGHVM